MTDAMMGIVIDMLKSESDSLMRFAMSLGRKCPHNSPTVTTSAKDSN